MGVNYLGILILAEAATSNNILGEVENFPLAYQIACILFTGMFLWTFSIARDPRGWRRLYQSRFTPAEEISVNRNKWLDERIKRYSLLISMLFLVVDVTCFVMGVTHQHRHSPSERTKADQFREQEMQQYR
ncbi:MAG: hypothetical protein ACAI34_09525 [Verrucomicrobium sp.]|nr:hypothetical protein [Verrucomicrobium sp.]